MCCTFFRGWNPPPPLTGCPGKGLKGNSGEAILAWKSRGASLYGSLAKRPCSGKLSVPMFLSRCNTLSGNMAVSF